MDYASQFSASEMDEMIRIMKERIEEQPDMFDTDNSYEKLLVYRDLKASQKTKFRCQWCPYLRFDKESELEMHVRVHNNISTLTKQFEQSPVTTQINPKKSLPLRTILPKINKDSAQNNNKLSTLTKQFKENPLTTEIKAKQLKCSNNGLTLKELLQEKCNGSKQNAQSQLETITLEDSEGEDEDSAKGDSNKIVSLEDKVNNGPTAANTDHELNMSDTICKKTSTSNGLTELKLGESSLKERQNCQTENSCPKCFKKFKNDKSLCMHLNSCYKKMYHCEICPDRQYYEIIDFRQHLIKCHSDGRSFKCPFCFNYFPKNSALKRHLETHNNLCHICNQLFPTRDYLKKHMLSNHLVQGDLARNTNALSNADKDWLNNYQVPPNSKKECPICKKCFNDDLYLKNHLHGCIRGKIRQNCTDFQSQCQSETIDLEDSEEEIENDDPNNEAAETAVKDTDNQIITSTVEDTIKIDPNQVTMVDIESIKQF